MTTRRAAALLLAAPLLAAPLRAQTPAPASQSVPAPALAPADGAAALQALDLVPPEAHSVLLMRDPFLTQLKVQALLKRFDMKKNPFGEFQTTFGLPKLPMDPRGIALVALPSASGDKEANLLLVPAKDPKAFADSLGAKPYDKGGKAPALLAYTAGKQPMLLGWKGGWAVLAPAAEAPTLRKLLKGAASIRKDLGELDGWAQGGDFSGIATPRGLQFQFGAIRRATQKAAAVEDPFTKILGQMERELTHVAYRGELDADGNLTFTLRCKLLPSGVWSTFGRDLRAPGALGLMGLGGDPGFFLAAGGSLPGPWMAELGQIMGDPMAVYALEGNDPDGALKARSEKLAAKVQATTVIMGADGKRAAILRTEDSKAYLEEYRAIQEALSKAMAGSKNPGLGFTTEPATVEGYPALLSYMDPPLPEGMDPALKADLQARGRQHPDTVRLTLDGERVLVHPGLPTAESLKQLLHPDRALADSDRLAPLAKHLPEDAHFYAFVNPTAMQAEEAKMEDTVLATMDEDLKGQYPRLPKVLEAPPMGVALRFDLDGWELDARVPVETQVAIGTLSRDSGKHNMTRVRLRMEQNSRDQERERRKHPAAPEPPRKDEAPTTGEDDGQE
ncbi:MAG TPA: hypothetical protein VJ600_08235 [Holophagaceae bacterium]|nr:hypothetical protein [Holophagaceae bacterium]